jgi:hypothetical protein
LMDGWMDGWMDGLIDGDVGTYGLMYAVLKGPFAPNDMITASIIKKTSSKTIINLFIFRVNPNNKFKFKTDAMIPACKSKVV